VGLEGSSGVVATEGRVTPLLTEFVSIKSLDPNSGVLSASVVIGEAGFREVVRLSNVARVPEKELLVVFTTLLIHDLVDDVEIPIALSALFSILPVTTLM
jgi:hypothetical protein